jgi:uncharacterized paraquat-inducible protein A
MKNFDKKYDIQWCECCTRYFEQRLLSEYKGKVVCPDCEDKLRMEDTKQKLTPNFKNLFNAVAYSYV